MSIASTTNHAPPALSVRVDGAPAAGCVPSPPPGLSYRRLTQLARAIVPEWRGTPIYPVLTSEGAPIAFCPIGTWGYCGPHLDVTLHPWLQAGRRWRDRGIAFWLDDVAIIKAAREACGDHDDLHATISRQWVAAVACHEMAHAVVDNFAARLDDVTPAFETFARTVTAGWCLKALPELPASYFGHEAPFIRVLLHLLHRASIYLGYRVPPAMAFRSDAYGLSSIWSYSAAIDDEPARMAGLPFSTITSTPPPAAFAKLWADDMARHEKERHEEQ